MLGNIVPSAALQLRHPVWNSVFNVDPAAATRARLMHVGVTRERYMADIYLARAGRMGKQGQGYVLVDIPSYRKALGIC